MRIELKNFKHYDRLSEETYCFTANIWVDGTKCGYAENRGFGGETSYHHEGTEASRQLIKQAEQYCFKMPPIVWQSTSSGKDLSIDMNLTNYIDELVSALVKKKEDESIAKKMNKEMQKAILIGTDTQYQVISFRKPLREVWETNPIYFKEVLNDRLEKYKPKGYRLLNTNIPQQFLTN
jgi:hypothetical protein